MKKIIVMALALTLFSGYSMAVSEADVHSYCKDFGLLLGAMLVARAESERVVLKDVLANAEDIAKRYGDTAFQTWAVKHVTTYVYRVSEMPMSQINEFYHQIGNSDFVNVAAGFQQTCKRQIK